MKTQLMALALLTGAVAAGPALAQGTFSGPPKSSSWSAPRAPGYTPYVPPKPKASAYEAPTARIYEPPKASTYEPFKPYKSQPGTSLFGPDGKPKR